jgi:hypothetical protein
VTEIEQIKLWAVEKKLGQAPDAADLPYTKVRALDGQARRLDREIKACRDEQRTTDLLEQYRAKKDLLQKVENLLRS